MSHVLIAGYRTIARLSREQLQPELHAGVWQLFRQGFISLTGESV